MLSEQSFFKQLLIYSTPSEQEFLTESSTEALIKKQLIEGSVEEKIDALNIALSRLNPAVSHRILPEVVKLLSTTDLELKRFCYLFTLLQCQNHRSTSALSITTLLGVNAFKKDACHRYHVVRGWSLRVMSSLGLPEITPAVLESMQRGVADGSPWVRQIVAQSVAKLYQFDKGLLQLLLQTVLLRLLEDVEVCVVGAACISFVQILMIDPDLLSTEPTTINQYQQKYEFDETETTFKPFLGCLHWYVSSLVKQVHRLPPYGQGAAIILLTAYFKTFLSRVVDSAHCETFVHRLKSLCKSVVPSVAILAAASLIDLSYFDATKLSEDLLHQIYALPNPRSSIHLASFLRLLTQVCLVDQSLSSNALHIFWLTPTDILPVFETKLDFWVKIISINPNFPLDKIFSEFFIALQWSWFFSESTQASYIRLIFSSVLNVLKNRLSVQPDVSNKDIQFLFLQLMNFALYSESSLIQEGAIATLWEMLSEASCRIDLKLFSSGLTCIAQQFIQTMEGSTFTKTTEEIQAKAVALIANCYYVAPLITIDFFRVLVSNITRLGFKVQLEVLNLGLVLMNENAVFRKGESQLSKNELARIDRLWSYLLATLSSTATNENYLCQFTAFIIYLLFNDCSKKICHAFQQTMPMPLPRTTQKKETLLWESLCFSSLSGLTSLGKSWKMPEFITNETPRIVVFDSSRTRQQNNLAKKITTLQGLNNQGHSGVKNFQDLESWLSEKPEETKSEPHEPATAGERGSVIFGSDSSGENASDNIDKQDNFTENTDSSDVDDWNTIAISENYEF